MSQPSDIPWQSTVPTCAQIDAHAAKHPLSLPKKALRTCAASLWLVCPTDETRLPMLVALAVEETTGATPSPQIWIPHATSVWMGLYSWSYQFRDAGWLPCTKDGIPVAMLDMAERIESHEHVALERGERADP